jgi:hypothetical protein
MALLLHGGTQAAHETGLETLQQGQPLAKALMLHGATYPEAQNCWIVLYTCAMNCYVVSLHGCEGLLLDLSRLDRKWSWRRRVFSLGKIKGAHSHLQSVASHGRGKKKQSQLVYVSTFCQAGAALAPLFTLHMVCM